MGYHVSSFALFTEIARRGELANVRTILELGSQEVSLQDHDNPEGMADFFAMMKAPLPTKEELLSWHSAPARKVFERAGFAYTSVDVNGQGGSKAFDLNFDTVPDNEKGTYDFVTNQGTIEHTVNVANGFKAVHDWTKPGGLMFHHMPFQNYVDHGFVNVQPNMYKALARHNDYEILGMWVNVDRGRLHFIPWERRLLEALDLNRAHLNLAVLLRKRSDAPFNLPVQGTYADELTDAAIGRYSYCIDGTTVMGKRGLVESNRGEIEALKDRLLHRISMKDLTNELVSRIRGRLKI
ncbi:MAG: methyltransferase domain-containing protein [Rhodospirillaceae bacterium]|nr:methyltransferase domain-containing protein [Rhodospirillales bacterium]